jgi:hypothetical protein
MQSAEEQPWPSPRRAWYALAVLTVALMVSTIDRSILSLLVGPIKHDLGVTDTQMSLLLGMAFVRVGLPGLLLAAVMATVKEPARRGLMRTDAALRAKSLP